ncbi:MAG: glycerol kinase GlpK [Eggerthellaceae bacterium]|jgi:glycerol kinase|nr:glycerol kinase GlpK [Eggerthellaceae bacterium]MDR2721815.1 glycerol kinase GlpK [Coriobacteriaceae bacterium]
MAKKYIVALDQGTSSSRAMLIDKAGTIRGTAQLSFKQHYPAPGWVEHDPLGILSSQLGALTNLLITHAVEPDEIESIGITNQRETTVVWNRETGEPLCNAIVWQCRRSAPLIEKLCADEQVVKRIVQTTGLVPDAYFSASKIAWILDNIPDARALAQAGKLAFGTIDSWLIWVLTHGKVHATDITNASRTMLFNIHSGSWDPWLCELFNIPMSMLPEVKPSSGYFGTTAHPNVVGGIPIQGVAGDQQAALFGQCCFEAGQAKNTYGTGCFLLMHTGSVACTSTNNLVTTVAASAPNTKHIEYALEGSVFMAGALIQWLRDELGLISSAAESETLARSVEDTAGVYVVPAFTGLGAPHWDAAARGAIVGLTRGAGRARIVRGALESLAYQVNDLIDAMQTDAAQPISVLNVDGGAAKNDFLMQFQSDISLLRLVRPESTESTALGAAYLAGLSTGFWKDVDELRSLRSSSREFVPDMTGEERKGLLVGWEEALNRVRTTEASRKQAPQKGRS